MLVSIENMKANKYYEHFCTFCFYHTYCLSFNFLFPVLSFFQHDLHAYVSKVLFFCSPMIIITILHYPQIQYFFLCITGCWITSSRFYSLFSAFPHFQMSRPYDEWCHLHTYSQISFRPRQIQTQQDIHPRKKGLKFFTILKLEFGCGRN